MFQKILGRLEDQDRMAEKERRVIKEMIADVRNFSKLNFESHAARIEKLEAAAIAHKAKVAVLIAIGSASLSLLAWIGQQYI